MDLGALKICIIGAGVAGLASARALALRGAEVTVLEQAEAVREVGAGLQVSPNGLAVLHALGLDAALRATALPAQAISLRDYSGAPVVRLDLTSLPPGQDYLLVHRADLIEVLAEGARDAGVAIRLLQKVDRVDLDGGVVHTACGNQLHADVIVGADGLHSVLRQQILGKTAPFFTHQVAWRAIIPNHLHFPAEARVYMGPKKHLVCYPLRDGAELNLVAVQERRDWAEEGWHHEDDPKNLQAAFAEFGPEVHALLDRVERVGLWGLFRHPVAPQWSQGRGVLMGDAAHPTLPFLAQGANMALEDAWVLADALQGAETVAEGFAAYQSRRRDRCARIIKAASGNAWKYHLSAPPVRWAAHLAMRTLGAVAPGQLLRQYAWIYGHDVTKG